MDDDVPTENTQGGGAIHNSFNDEDNGLTIIRSAFNGNLSFDAPGGAIYNTSDGYLHVRDSSFNGNIAGDLTTETMGGAIYNQEVLDIRRVMFLANVASRGDGGAIANDRTGQATLANVTFTANGAPDGYGGAIWNGNTQQGGPASSVTLYHTTFSLNACPNAGAAIFNQSDGQHTGTLKYGYSDLRPALEPASARETAGRVAVGSACRQLLGFWYPDWRICRFDR